MKPARNDRAFTVLELMLVVFVLAVLVALLLPALGRHNHTGMRVNCINNLKQVGLSFKMWANDNKEKFPMDVSTNAGGTKEFKGSTESFRHFQALSNELSTPTILVCPEDKKRVTATNFTTDFNNAKVSYFVGLDADDAKPEMLLAGDWNLTNGIAPVNGVMTLTTNALPGWTKAIHQLSGRVALADGSVLKWATADLKRFLMESAVATNRLALPDNLK